MTKSTNDRFRTGGAFDAMPDYEADLESKLSGRVLSGYRVGSIIGSGGMGYVLRATRAEGDFDRVAAIKVVVAPHNSSELALRFRQEVQILARLNHPSIAQLYDAGQTDEGWPYLVMEYVDGCPVDEYCRKNDVSLEDRVRLMMDVSEAVQFAHARLIVHRDLKPSNVFVDKRGKLKLLDFGIAKVVEDEPDDATRARVLTPRYASPEQLLGQPISIASDVYQLGLLMTEVFGGRLPTEDETLTDAIRRSASGRLVTLPAATRRSLPGDLVSIIELCLRTDPEDRYRDANRLRDDLQAWLTDFPIHAVGQNSGYRVRKFVRRNWGGVLSAVLVVLALISATLITTLQTIEAKKQRDIALYQQQRVHASNEFYGLLLSEMGDGNFTSVDLLDRGRTLLEDQYGLGQPFMASVLFDVSKRYADLGERSQQRELLTEAERLAREYGDDDMLIGILCGQARSNRIGAPLLADQQLAEGLDVLGRTRSAPIDTSIECYRAQSDAAVKSGNFAEALPPLREALSKLDQEPLPSPRAQSLLLTDIAFVQFYRGQPEQAVSYLDEALKLLNASGRGSTLLYQNIAANKAVTLTVLGHHPEALQTFADIREIQQTNGLEDRGAALLMAQYGDALVEVGRTREAASVYTEGLDIASAAGNSRVVASFHVGMAKVSLTEGDTDTARDSLARAATFVNDGKPRPLARGIKIQQTKLWRLSGEYEEAERAIDSLLADLGYPDNRRGMGLARVLGEGVEVFRTTQNYERAYELANGLVAVLKERAKDESVGNLHLGKALLQRGTVQLEAGKEDVALSDIRAALPHLTYALGESHPDTVRARMLLSEPSSHSGLNSAGTTL